MNPLGAAGHIARDAGRAAERSARIAGYQQQTRERAQEMAGQLHAQVAVRGSAAFTKQRVAVDGAETLEYARRFLAHLVVWPSPEALTLATLWAAHTHCRDANGMLVFLSSPRLLFSSAEPGSGKSEAMKAVSRLCPSPVLMTEPSEPAVAHSVGAHDCLFLERPIFCSGRALARPLSGRSSTTDTPRTASGPRPQRPGSPAVHVRRACPRGTRQDRERHRWADGRDPEPGVAAADAPRSRKLARSSLRHAGQVRRSAHLRAAGHVGRAEP